MKVLLEDLIGWCPSIACIRTFCVMISKEKLNWGRSNVKLQLLTLFIDAGQANNELGSAMKKLMRLVSRLQRKRRSKQNHTNQERKSIASLKKHTVKKAFVMSQWQS